jgi:hypothetical protein
MINRVPVYCDICKSLDALSYERLLTLLFPTATRIQVALNVAIPACSLCINHRIYRITTMKAVVTEKRQAVIQDLLIGVGIPILQIIARECAYPFNITVTGHVQKMQSRVCCFVESLQHN